MGIFMFGLIVGIFSCCLFALVMDIVSECIDIHFKKRRLELEKKYKEMAGEE